MGVQEVDGVNLQRLETRLSEKFQNIRSQVQKLNQTIDNLEGNWRGIGAGAFNAKQTRINQDLQFLSRLLDGFVGSIQDTRKLSGNTEDDVAQRMNKLQGQGGLTSDSGGATQSSLAGEYSKLGQY